MDRVNFIIYRMLDPNSKTRANVHELLEILEDVEMIEQVEVH